MEEVTQEPGTQTEQAETEPTPPSVDELQQENARKEAEIKRLQGISKDLQKRGVSQEQVQSLHKKIDDMQEWTAGVMDDLATKIGGDYEEPKPTRKGYREQLNERRQQAPQAQPEAPPDIEEFMTYIAGLGFTIQHPQVQEAVAEDRSPTEALNYLKEKMDTKNQAEIKKQVALGVEEEMKKRGLTTSGASGPSASSTKVFSAKQIADMPIEEFKANKEAIEEAQRLGKIKD